MCNFSYLRLGVYILDWCIRTTISLVTDPDRTWMLTPVKVWQTTATNSSVDTWIKRTSMWSESCFRLQTIIIGNILVAIGIQQGKTIGVNLE